MSTKIPKIFWQTYKTHQVPQKWITSPKSIMKYHPHPVNICKCMHLHIFKGCGVYMDMDLDLEVLKPLDDLFESGADFYLVRTPNWMGYTNSFMASKPNCPFWIRCIEKIKYRLDHRPWYILGDINVLWTTGPAMISASRKYM